MVNTDGIHIVAEDVWGALRGLETLSQLVFCSRNTVVYQYWLHHGSIITLKLIKLKKKELQNTISAICSSEFGQTQFQNNPIYL